VTAPAEAAVAERVPARRPLVIAKMGCSFPELVERRGDYEHWIGEGLGLPAGAVRVVRVFEGEELPPPRTLSGVVMTGSASMVSDRLPWSERAAAWLRELVPAGTPFLGICYGHQLLAHAFSGRVARNPRGREIGSVRVALRAEARSDPLLGGLPELIDAQATHVESVLELPPGARWLASSAGDPHHAFALGPRAWGLQFHPEFDASVIRHYLAERRELLAAEGLDAAALLRGVVESPASASLLRRFARIVAERERGAPETRASGIERARFW
jgi:GMP synthase (glutamine-hydrolysing)